MSKLIFNNCQNIDLKKYQIWLLKISLSTGTFLPRSMPVLSGDKYKVRLQSSKVGSLILDHVDKYRKV